MNHDEAVDFIIKELSKHHNRNEIIVSLCHHMDIGWPEAERLIKDVESHHGRQIAAGQSPLLIILGAGILTAGIGMTAYAIQFFFNFARMSPADKLLYATTVYYMAGTLITGLGMIAGSVVGFWNTFSALFEND